MNFVGANISIQSEIEKAFFGDGMDPVDGVLPMFSNPGRAMITMESLVVASGVIISYRN